MKNMDQTAGRVRIRTQELSWQVAGDHIVVLDLQGSEYLRINGTGRIIWELLVEPRAVDELVDVVTAEFDIDRETSQLRPHRYPYRGGTR